MIDDKIAVGDSRSKYDNFDIIVNLNYPENNVKENDIRVRKTENKLMIEIGIMDCDNEDKELCIYKYISEIIPLLYKYYINKKILFHCYTGISRSATFAIAYLCYINNISIDNAFSIVKSKRKFIQPNKSFMKALLKFEKFKNNQLEI
jgi:protein-tyrosine phosphatase